MKQLLNHGAFKWPKHPDRIKSPSTLPDAGLLAFRAVFQANHSIRHALIKLKMKWLKSALLHKPRNKIHFSPPSSLVNTIPILLETYQNCLFSSFLKTKNIKRKNHLQATLFKVILIYFSSSNLSSDFTPSQVITLVYSGFNSMVYIYCFATDH